VRCEGADEIVLSGGIEGDIGWSGGCNGESIGCGARIKSGFAYCRNVMLSGGEVEDQNITN